ncbi:hypothetical protein UNSW3_723 [Campylobacter concisus UNSW3]|uniref:Uncharacterized protein n=1 Tax=Campylobacter concisus UNSW3 TaxID=1242966 RepID=U2EBU2_9BACT|nr:hypothetical protein UNSWCD_1127 [Campylobacter concisus UNSWCD]ERJ21091.1 hypothetical protein UNSW3_723 [Campylobacter concisus UNSW3]
MLCIYNYNFYETGVKIYKKLLFKFSFLSKIYSLMLVRILYF